MKRAEAKLTREAKEPKAQEGSSSMKRRYESTAYHLFNLQAEGGKSGIKWIGYAQSEWG
jgi:hypothetical protein